MIVERIVAGVFVLGFILWLWWNSVESRVEAYLLELRRREERWKQWDDEDAREERRARRRQR